MEVSILPAGSGFSKTFSVEVWVRRSETLALIRLVFPSVVLVALSWGGFWIRPAALVPRFASGFISFLGLQSFRKFASALMPNEGQLNTMCWIDVYMSAVGILMGLSVIQTFATQYVCEKISTRLGIRMDCVARWAFPLIFLVVLVFMSAAVGRISSFAICVVIHSFLAVFSVCFSCFVAYEIVYFPALFFERALSAKLSGAQRHRECQLSLAERQRIFDTLDRLSPGQAGIVKVDSFTEWLLHVKPQLKANRTGVNATMISLFKYHKDLHFPLFSEDLEVLITRLTLLLYDKPATQIRKMTTRAILTHLQKLDAAEGSKGLEADDPNEGSPKSHWSKQEDASPESRASRRNGSRGEFISL